MAGGLGGGWEETGARSQKEVGANAGSWKQGGGQGARRRWRVEGGGQGGAQKAQRGEGGWRVEAGGRGAGWSAGWSAGWRLKAGAQVGAPEPAQAGGWKGGGTNQER